ncbi:cytochrome C oxidase subunit I [Virgibacillus sp. MSP4-1]|nr:cytochrome C oxidase subunit I [Virgibacillus sp. MSP4-1]
MMIFGVVMLLNQGNVIKIGPDFFYQLMTVHGIGMVGMATIGGVAIMWYFLSKYVALNPKIFKINITLSVLAIVSILIAVFGFKFSDAWTFLYPLPSQSAAAKGMAGAMFFFSGILLLGIGLLIVYFEAARKIRKQYGKFLNGLGWDVLFGKKEGYGPPAAVVASTMVVIVNTSAILAGASVILMSIITILFPAIQFDPMLAKHLTYAFGHVFANATIYMGVIAVYEILSSYTNRPWKASKSFLVAWNCSTLFTLMIYTHHLLMDFAVPRWMLIIGQVFSYANGLPVMVVTAYGALMIVYKSKIKWDMASGFMFISMFGWVAGAIPAIVDSTIRVNHVMHNTKWVPAHFHTYMGIGITTMVIGFLYYFSKAEGKRTENKLDYVSLFSYLTFFTGLVGTFLYAGAISVPRRWAVHLPEWAGTSQAGAFFGIMVTLTTLYIFIRFIGNLKHNLKDHTEGEKHHAA